MSGELWHRGTHCPSCDAAPTSSSSGTSGVSGLDCIPESSASVSCLSLSSVALTFARHVLVEDFLTLLPLFAVDFRFGAMALQAVVGRASGREVLCSLVSSDYFYSLWTLSVPFASSTRYPHFLRSPVAGCSPPALLLRTPVLYCTVLRTTFAGPFACPSALLQNT